MGVEGIARRRQPIQQPVRVTSERKQCIKCLVENRVVMGDKMASIDGGCLLGCATNYHSIQSAPRNEEERTLSQPSVLFRGSTRTFLHVSGCSGLLQIQQSGASGGWGLKFQSVPIETQLLSLRFKSVSQRFVGGGYFRSSYHL